MTPHRVPKDVEELISQLPGHASANINRQTILFIRHEAAKLSGRQNKRESKKYVKKVMEEFFRLVREAGARHNGK